MTPIPRLIAVSAFAVLVSALSPVALSRTAQESVDERQRFSSLLEKAEKGGANAQLALVVRYARGEGVPKNAAEAVKWFRLVRARL